MNDYNRKRDAALADPILKEMWDNRDNRVNSSDTYENEQHNNPSEQYQNSYGFDFESNLENIELIKQAIAEEERREYKNWVEGRTGLRNHRWLLYPEDLRQRIRNGERGLMLGHFWKYIL